MKNSFSIKNTCHKRYGFSLVEVILAIALFALIITGLIGAIMFGEESTALAGKRARATYIAEEGLEAVRNIKDSGFKNLPGTDGDYGFDNTGGQWSFLPLNSQNIIEDFTRKIHVTTIDGDTKEITANVTWKENEQRMDTISLATRLTNWKKQKTFRVTEYYIPPGTFTLTTYYLNLNQNLSPNYFVMIQGSDGSGTTNIGPDKNYVIITEDPAGTGDLNASGANNRIRLTRGGYLAGSSWVGTVTVVECLGDETNSGFRLLDVKNVQHLGTATSGSSTSASWGPNLNQVMLIGSFNGSGCNTSQTTAASTKVCHVRLWPTGTNIINWSRSAAGVTLTNATSAVMVLQWGSNWTVQRRTITGSNGGNGANATSEYNTAAISQINRNNTWIWGTGHTDDTSVGAAAEGTLITLGDGVNQNIYENLLAIGQEYSIVKSFEVYALSHPDLTVDYRFKADGDANALTYNITSDSAATGNRMSIITNGSNGTGAAYPTPMWSSRYTSDNQITLERRRSGQAWPAWVQGIDFSNIGY